MILFETEGKLHTEKGRPDMSQHWNVCLLTKVEEY